MERIITWADLANSINKREETFEVTGVLALKLIPIVKQMEKKPEPRKALLESIFSVMKIKDFLNGIKKIAENGLVLYLLYKNYYYEEIALDYFKFTLKKAEEQIKLAEVEDDEILNEFEKLDKDFFN